jgi:hypothetical protein
VLESVLWSSPWCSRGSSQRTRVPGRREAHRARAMTGRGCTAETETDQPPAQDVTQGLPSALRIVDSHRHSSLLETAQKQTKGASAAITLKVCRNGEDTFLVWQSDAFIPGRRRLCQTRSGERLALGPRSIVAEKKGPLESRRVSTGLPGPSVSAAPLLRSPRGDGRVSGLCRSGADPGDATGTGPSGDASPDASSALRVERWRKNHPRAPGGHAGTLRRASRAAGKPQGRGHRGLR